MDDEQGPWWTRPPEPGTQAPQVQRRRPNEPHDVEVDYPPAEQTVVVPAPTEYFRPRLVEPAPPEPEPEPEPTPPPTPPKPVVRRVAVVPPTPPPVRTVGRNPSDDRTETLPAVSDDIFATFSGPLPQGDDPSGAGRGGSGRSGSGRSSSGRGGSGAPHPAGRAPVGDPLDEAPSNRPPGLPGLLAQVKEVKLPEPRVLLLGAAAALVALLIVVVALVSGRGTKADPEAGTPTAGPSPASAASALPGKDPAGLKQVSALDAAAQLRKANQGPGGSIVEAWGWNDKNGRNLVVTSIASAGANKRTLRVIHVAQLDSDPVTLRVMRDPRLPANCRTAGTAGFTPRSLIVRDLDGNNVAEVISGWTSRCGAAGTESQIKLALITNGQKYILRGQGVVGQPGGSFTPDPQPSRWPNGFQKALTSQYRKLYS